MDNKNNIDMSASAPPTEPPTPPTVKQNKKSAITPFWLNDPNVLFQSTAFFPVVSMSYEEKLNSIVRALLVITIIAFAMTYNVRLFAVAGLVIASISIYYYYQLKQKHEKETFMFPAEKVMADYGIIKENTFDAPTPTNPFSNVMLGDYTNNPNKLPAPPLNIDTNKEITDIAKSTVIGLNKDQPDIGEKLFTDLGEQFVFEQSLRQFYSNPSTTIPNDQTAFAEFCYGGMVSCKTGNKFACGRNLQRYTNY